MAHGVMCLRQLLPHPGGELWQLESETRSTHQSQTREKPAAFAVLDHGAFQAATRTKAANHRTKGSTMPQEASGNKFYINALEPRLALGRL